MKSIEEERTYHRNYYKNHIEKFRALNRGYAGTHKEERNAYYKKYMEDPDNIKKVRAQQLKWYREHKDRVQKRMIEKRGDIKREVLAHYGGDLNRATCFNCGEQRLDCLSIDHINNDGASHRKGMRNKGGQAFYSWLKRNNYPTGYQTLCMNCQWIKQLEYTKLHRTKFHDITSLEK